MLTIVIPQYGNAGMTVDCINAIIENTDIPYEVILIDNASPEVIPDEVKSKVRYYRMDTNLKYARGTHKGVSLATGDMLCLMNNDVIVSKGWCDPIKLFEDTSVGQVGVRLLYPNRTIQHAGVRFNSSLAPFHIHRNCHSDYPGVMKQLDLQAVTGALIFMRKEDFIAVGMFDLSYVNGYYEDIDLSLKVRFDLNKRVVYYPFVDVLHLEGQAPVNYSSTMQLNHDLFLSKWSSMIIVDG